MTYLKIRTQKLINPERNPFANLIVIDKPKKIRAMKVKTKKLCFTNYKTYSSK